MRLLLLSNSTNAGEAFLSHAETAVRTFLGEAVREVLFVPFAGVRMPWKSYAARVRARFAEWGYGLTSLYEVQQVHAAIAGAEALVVGGGNTFHLVYHLYERGVMEPLRQRVTAGTPYIGWSAGANIAAPTLHTTNDMPIVEPPSFRTLGLVPFQINPHFLDAHPDGHMGETREERLLEFTAVNPAVPVLGLREGSMLRVEGDQLRLLGDRTARLFRAHHEPEELPPGVLHLV
jgi:dipeptidase E